MEGGEGNRDGWMEEGKGSSGLVGDKSGKKTGWMGDTGEGDTGFVACLLKGGEGHEA